MQDLSTGQGRTVLFVSHNMEAVKQLCNWGTVLERGGVKYKGNIENTIDAYIESGNLLEIKSERSYEIDKTKPFQVEKVEITDKIGRQREVYEALEEITVRIHCVSVEEIPQLYGCFFLKRENKEYLIVCDSMELGVNIFNNMAVGKYVVEIVIPAGLLAPGSYVPNLGFASTCYAGFSVAQYLDILRFNVNDAVTERANKRDAVTTVILDWKIIETHEFNA
jgi:lipopolysaccharide transport system ATP-binding protein